MTNLMWCNNKWGGLKTRNGTVDHISNTQLGTGEDIYPTIKANHSVSMKLCHSATMTTGRELTYEVGACVRRMKRKREKRWEGEGRGEKLMGTYHLAFNLSERFASVGI